MRVEFDLHVSSLWFPYIVADACCIVSHETYLQLNAMRSTWLQVAVPRADGDSLHNYYSPCIDCLVLYIVIVFCWFNLSLVYIPYFRSGIRRCSYVVSSISLHLHSSMIYIRQWSSRYDLHSSMTIYMQTFIIKLAFLAAWLCLTYCCCGYCHCCDEFIWSSHPALINFISHTVLRICIGRRGFGQIN
jgi:hypothetical protein